MAKVNPISAELEQLADKLYEKFPGVILAVQIQGSTSRKRPKVIMRGDDPDVYWLAHATWHQAPDPPTRDDGA
jgi:hypothetical protein